MRRKVITADPKMTLLDLARMMLHKHVHRIVIVEGGGLRGIVTTLDLLRGLLARRPPAKSRSTCRLGLLRRGQAPAARQRVGVRH